MRQWFLAGAVVLMLLTGSLLVAQPHPVAANPQLTATPSLTPMPTSTTPETYRVLLPLIQKLNSPGTQWSVPVVEQLQWLVPPTEPQNVNLVVVLDYSASMRYCWDTNTTCAAGTRRIDAEIAAARDLIQEMLVTRPANDPLNDNQMALVRFGIKSGSLYTSEFMVPFTSDPQQFWNKIGAPGSSYTVPSSELNGYTPTAAGLSSARQRLLTARNVDKNGNPVAGHALLLTDGVPNVLFDAPYVGRVNDAQGPSAGCLTGPAPTDDPAMQFLCPAPTSAVRSPIRAAIEESGAIHAAGYDLAIMTLGSDPGLPNSHFELMAPGNLYPALQPADLTAAIMGFSQEIGVACNISASGWVPAAGATAILRDSGGVAVQTTLLASDGMLPLPFGGTFQPGYTLEITHTAVVAENDPQQKPHDYNQLTVPWALPTQATQPITLPIVGYQQPILLSATTPPDCNHPNAR